MTLSQLRNSIRDAIRAELETTAGVETPRDAWLKLLDFDGFRRSRTPAHDSQLARVFPVVKLADWTKQNDEQGVSAHVPTV